MAPARGLLTRNKIVHRRRYGKTLPRRKCCVPEEWRDSAGLWQAVGWLRERLVRAPAQLVPVVHRRDPRARVATATSPAARRAGGPCGPTGTSVLVRRLRRKPK